MSRQKKKSSRAQFKKNRIQFKEVRVFHVKIRVTFSKMCKEFKIFNQEYSSRVYFIENRMLYKMRKTNKKILIKSGWIWRAQCCVKLVFILFWISSKRSLKGPVPSIYVFSHRWPWCLKNKPKTTLMWWVYSKIEGPRVF